MKYKDSYIDWSLFALPGGANGKVIFRLKVCIVSFLFKVLKMQTILHMRVRTVTAFNKINV